MTMVEQVARALCKEASIDPDKSDEWAPGVDRKNWESRIGAARAAIGAMREPTEAMVDAGSDIEDIDGNDIGLTAAQDAWQAMIDEALK